MDAAGFILPKSYKICRLKNGGGGGGDKQIPFGHILILWVGMLVLMPHVGIALCLVFMCSRKQYHSLKISGLKNFC